MIAQLREEVRRLSEQQADVGMRGARSEARANENSGQSRQQFDNAGHFVGPQHSDLNFHALISQFPGRYLLNFPSAPFTAYLKASFLFLMKSCFL